MLDTSSKEVEQLPAKKPTTRGGSKAQSAASNVGKPGNKAMDKITGKTPSKKKPASKASITKENARLQKELQKQQAEAEAARIAGM